MDKRKKTFIHKTVAAPLIIGAVTAVVFFIMLPVVSGLFPLSDEKIELAGFEQPVAEIAIDYSSLPVSGEIKKSDIIFDESNAIAGSVKIGSKEVPLVYDADNASLSNAVSISENGKYIGETGTAYVYGIKSVVDINAFHTGQEVEVKTVYGKYVFTVSEIKTVPFEYKIFSMNTDVKRGLVLYTNAKSGFGVSSSMSAVVMEMKSGPTVTE